MAIKPTLPLAAHSQQLAYWVVIRTLVLSALIAALAICRWQDIDLPYLAITVILGLMAGLNCLTYLRLRNPLAVTSSEFFVQLLLDILGLSLLLYGSGGANNPFISYFLVPICVSAACLNSRYTLTLAGISLVSYSSLLVFHRPLPMLSPHHGASPWNLHILGMWLNFFISAGLITIFIAKMARNLRTQETQLSQLREDQLRDEQLMAVATLAAGTAHELGTPLSTMKLLLNEMRNDYPQPGALQNDLQLLQQQLEQCTNTLRNLVSTAEQNREGAISAQTVKQFCETIIARWQLLRPEVQYQLHYTTARPLQLQRFHPSLHQALINLLNNAADANPHNIIVSIGTSEQHLEWRIEDEGPGISHELIAQLGKTFISSEQGLGIGFYITQASINRYGGSVSLHRRKPQGTITHVILPLQHEEAIT